MEKILLWGTGRCYKAHYEELHKLIKKNNIEILALINRTGILDIIDGCHVIKKEEIENYEYDKIVITADETEAQSIRNDARELNIDEKMLISIWIFLDVLQNGEEFYDQLIQKQKNIVK